MSECPVRHGGLMRCCLATVQAYGGPEVPGETVIECAYERVEPARIRLAHDGVWEWDEPENQELAGAL